MDLHNLHRPSPSPAQQAARPKQDPISSSGVQEALEPRRDLTELAHLTKELEKARAHAAHWQRETEKMDKIARDAMVKLEAKSEAKRALKAEFDVARKDADAWRTRYKELSEARTAASTDTLDLHDRLAGSQTSERRLHEELEQARRALRQHEGVKEELDQARRALQQHKGVKEELDQARRALQQHEVEHDAIRERLQVGGNAFRKLQILEPKLAASEQRVRDLESKLAASEARIRNLEADLATLRTASTRQAGLDNAKARQADLDLAAAKDKLRAATQDASAKASQVQACADMLARTEQVLKTCSQLYAAKEEAHPLAQALLDSTSTISQFLARMESAKRA